MKRSGHGGHPCQVPDFSVIASGFSPFRMMLTVGFSYATYVLLSYIPSSASFDSTLSCWILSKAFSTSIEMVILFCPCWLNHLSSHLPCGSVPRTCCLLLLRDSVGQASSNPGLCMLQVHNVLTLVIVILGSSIPTGCHLKYI